LQRDFRSILSCAVTRPPRVAAPGSAQIVLSREGAGFELQPLLIGKSDEMQVKKCSTWTAASPSIQASSNRQASPCRELSPLANQHTRDCAQCNIFMVSGRKIVGSEFLPAESERAMSLADCERGASRRPTASTRNT
jgi:hypothetical protein